MEQRRFIFFWVAMFALMMGWFTFGPIVFPALFPKPKPVAQKNVAKKDADGKAADEKRPAKDAEAAAKDGDPADERPVADNAAVGSGKTEDGKQPAEGEKPTEEPAEKPAAEGEKRPDVAEKPAPKFEERTIELGSPVFASGFRQFVKLTSQGAAIESIELNDDRYRDLEKPHPPLVLVGTDAAAPHTLALAVPDLKNKDLFASANWEVIDVQPVQGPHHKVAFRLRLDDLEIVKRYELPAVGNAGATEADAYALKVEIEIKNLRDEKRTVAYTLQGPTGLPLENIDNTQKFRDVVVGFETAPGQADYQLLSAKTIADGKPEEWKKGFLYVGVDIQYFAALLCPVDDQLQNRYTDSVKQEWYPPNQQEKTDISVLLTSVPLNLAAAKDKDGLDVVTHSYTLFAGPKRDDVLPPYASKVIDFGMFHWVSRPMLALLKAFHAVFRNWGIAIICLTIVVRGALFPLSIKQARSAAKMQELQPELAALKEKYGKDKEKFARAQMELFSKHKYNPFAGCLPIFLQLPVFMGLYQALNHSVDLRMARFLYIDNLAAPDALFNLPFAIPLLGWTQFNLLPIFTIGLFLAQQKMFMPPAQNDEQRVQQKTMSWVTVFMGIMFYKVAAGMCVYFIASSLWGIGERKLLPKAKPTAVPPPPPPSSGPPGDRRRPPPPGDDKGNGTGDGFIARILKAAEKEVSARRESERKRR